MSLGFSSIQGAEFMRVRRPSPQVPPGGPTMNTTTRKQSQGPSIAVRVEVLEIAVKTLSDNLSDLKESIRDNGTCDMDILSGIEEKIKSLEDNVSLPMTADTRPVNDNNDFQSVINTSALYVRAKVCKPTELYTNISGILEEDIKKEKPSKLSVGENIRLLFPQYIVGDQIFMGAVTICPQTMTPTVGWVHIYDTGTDTPYVDEFSV